MTPEKLARRYFDNYKALAPLSGLAVPAKWEDLAKDVREHLISTAESLLFDMEDNGCPNFNEHEPIHMWFELTYAQYLTIPRSVLQSMPQEWQARFVGLLKQLDATFDWHPKEGRYWVKLKDGKGRYVQDPLMDYERGRRLITPKQKEQ